MSGSSSANDTVVTVSGGSITDASNNVWSLVNGQVAVNGVIDPTTANVTALAYVNGQIWQRNASNLWWAKTSPGDGWSPPYGTPTSPLVASGNLVSADDTVATAAGQTITDANHNVWSISPGKQVLVNGAVDTTTANVIALTYVNGQIWQENASGLWWAKSTPSDGWSPTYGTSVSPLPASATLVSANNTVLGQFTGGTITDANHVVWSLNSGGQVVVNGTVDQTTANVVTLAYENGQIWQENASGLWWAKTSPSDGWSPPYGTTASPLPATLTWVGGADNAALNPLNWSPNGAPQPGDTLQVAKTATINVAGNDLAGDTLNITNPSIGQQPPVITINAADSAQLNLSMGLASAANINVADTATLNVSAVHGALTTSGGTIQFIGLTEFGATVAILNNNLTGNGTVALSGGQGEGTSVEVNGSAGSDLTFTVGGVAQLRIDHPDQFTAAIQIGSGTPLSDVLFAGLTATSGQLANGVLSLFNGNQLIDQTRVSSNLSTLTLGQSSAGVVLDENNIDGFGSTSHAIPLTFS